MTISIDDQIAVVRRELALRMRNYPNWVSSGKMKERDANYQITAMQAVHDSLERLRELEKSP